MKTATKAIIDSFTLKAGFTVEQTSTARDDAQISIHKDGVLSWRGWEFESDFEYDLIGALEYSATRNSIKPVEEKTVIEIKDQDYVMKHQFTLDDIYMSVYHRIDKDFLTQELIKESYELTVSENPSKTPVFTEFTDLESAEKEFNKLVRSYVLANIPAEVETVEKPVSSVVLKLVYTTDYSEYRIDLLTVETKKRTTGIYYTKDKGDLLATAKDIAGKNSFTVDEKIRYATESQKTDW